MQRIDPFAWAFLCHRQRLDFTRQAAMMFLESSRTLWGSGGTYLRRSSDTKVPKKCATRPPRVRCKTKTRFRPIAGIIRKEGVGGVLPSPTQMFAILNNEVVQ